MMKNIMTTVKGRQISIPNEWEQLSPAAYEALIADLQLFATGALSPARVKINYVCRHLGIALKRIKNEDALANIVWLAEQVTFPFLISYPDKDAALQSLSAEDRAKFKKTPPERMQGHALARYLSKLPYAYVLDCKFCAQMLPVIVIDCVTYRGYNIDTSFGVLTCSLTALQYLEANSVSRGGKDQLPLLAAMLYHPGAYNSQSAQELAAKFATLPEATLQAIAFNFTAFVNWLFACTEYDILTRGKESKSAISVGATEALYNLSADGLGNSEVIEQMNLIKYLSILRKKLIESVRSLKSADMKPDKIAAETGLPIDLITQIL